MRQLIAVIVCLLVSVSAWGQEPIQVATHQVCNGKGVDVPFTQREWALLDDFKKAEACLSAEVAARQAAATQTATTQTTYDPYAPYAYAAPKQMRSPMAAGLGLLFTAVGVLVALPHGDTYTVLHEPYCVTEYSVDYGVCSKTEIEKMIGLALIGTGVTMMIVGSREVNVSPMLGHGVKGASATIRWGGAHVRR